MALNPTTLKASFLSKLNSLSFDETTSDSEIKEAYAQAMAEFVVEAITSATVTVPALGFVSAAPGSPVTGISNTGALS